jgi:hypothetical protein
MRAVFVAAAVVALLVGCDGSSHALRLPRDPYLGLRCHYPVVLRCGRAGLAVWLGRPARSVTATVDGHDFRLRTRSGGTGSYRRGLFWHGVFPDPNAQKFADASRSILVRVSVIANDGSTGDAKAVVYVSEGYG